MKTVTELSPAEHLARKERDRAKYAARREARAAKAKERYHQATPEEKERRSAYNRAKYAAQTEADRALRLEKDRARRAAETPEQRQLRLDKILVTSRRRGGVKNPTAERKTGMCSVRGCPYEGALEFDHWHSGPREGLFRGWLCAKCNPALGLADDSPDRLRALAEYIELAQGVGWPVDTDPPAG